jgi:hypothetical protein
MVELTDHLLASTVDLDRVFRDAVDDALRGGKRPRADYAVLAHVRAAYGFAHDDAPLLTPPGKNAKLDHSIVPAYGFTGQHFRVVLPARDGFPRLVINACPNAGHCTRVCVLDNGHGQDPMVQRARMWRTDLLARHPEVFARILAWELVKAVRKHGNILFRPNVNSDVAWQQVLPSLTDGHLSGVTSYGYSKRPETLAGDGWLGSAYRVAYSWNETSNATDVRAFLMRGGAVAVVTDRRKGTPVLSVFPFGTTANAVDADITDEWMLARGVVGDLSAKGKARKLIGRSRFVVRAA